MLHRREQLRILEGAQLTLQQLAATTKYYVPPVDEPEPVPMVDRRREPRRGNGRGK